ncbi:MAG TPA: YncE family protein [Gemmatimonadales bacterium]
MRRAAPVGVLLCSLASVLVVSCSDETPTSIAASEPAFAASAPSACEPKTRPGKIVEKVETPPAWGIAVRDDGLTYFSVPFQDIVGITSTTARRVIGSIPSSSWPLGLAFSPDGGTAYVTHLFSNDVGVIDVATGQEVAKIPTGDASPFVVRVSPSGDRVYIATNGNAVLIASTATNQVEKTVEVGDAPNAFAVHPDGRMMYVSAFFGGTVSEIDMITETVLRTFFVGGVPQDMAVNKKGNRLYIANEAGFINEIDLLNGTQLPDIPLKGGGFGIGVTPDDGEAYVAEPGNGLVEVFSLQSRKLTRTLTVGGEPRRVAFSQQGRIGAISNMAGFITFVR